MKFTGESKDGVLDILLRAYVSRPSNPPKTCTEFDPDQANAYIERRLTGSLRSQYEQHLSECTGCRKNVIALIRLSDSEIASAVPTLEVPKSRWFGGIQQAFGVLARPQWAFAAAALVVLGISIPLFLSLNRNQPETQVVATNPAAADSERPVESPASLTSAKPSPETAQVADSIAPVETRKHEKAIDKLEAKSEPASRNGQPASGDSAGAAGLVASADLSKKQDVSAAAQPVQDAQVKGESQVKSESQVAQSQVQTTQAPGAQAARNEAQLRQQQTTEKDSPERVAEPKPRTDQGTAGKEKAKLAEEAAAPPPAESEASRQRGSRREAPRAFRDPNTGDAVRPEGRKISGKTFFFRSGTWTDKDYDPEKDLPTVSVVRDSNTYKELLSKRTGLKPIMEKFTAAERAIIVYKGTVYKLFPQ